jgi:hypothetical protein
MPAGAAKIFNETYTYYRDEDPEQKRMNYPGDLRAALMPMLAYERFKEQGFKWLMYADDVRLLNAAGSQYALPSPTQMLCFV